MKVRIINTIIVKANEHNKNIEELWFSGTVPKILPPNKKPKTKQTKINIDKESLSLLNGKEIFTTSANKAKAVTIIQMVSRVWVLNLSW